MKRIVITLALSIITTNSVLAEEPSKKDQSQTIEQEKNAAEYDTKKFCYFEDKKYSEGAKLNNHECKPRQTFIVSERDNQPLTWQKIYIRKNTANHLN